MGDRNADSDTVARPPRLVRTWFVAILALVGGALYLCGGALGLAGLAIRDAQLAMIESMPAGPQREMQLAMMGDDFLGLQIVGLIANMLASGLLIAGGVGLILRRAFGRLLGVVGGGLLIAGSLVGLVVQQQMLAKLEEVGGLGGGTPFDAGMAVGMKVGFILGAVCNIGVPLACMAVLLTPAVGVELRSWAAWRSGSVADTF